MTSRGEVLRLYKQLLKYGKELQLTDKAFFKERITKEFKQNKELDNPKDIEFNFLKGQELLKRALII